MGDFALATKAAKEAIAAAKATDEPAGRVEAGPRSAVFVEKGDFANAIPLLEEALRLVAWHLEPFSMRLWRPRSVMHTRSAAAPTRASH